MESTEKLKKLNESELAVVEVTKKFTFDAAHRLPNYRGKCYNLHGHRYEMEITVRGKIDPSSGMVIDFGEVKEVVDNCLMPYLDHRYLNEDMPFENTTVENLVVWTYHSLNRLIQSGVLGRDVELKKVKIKETDSCWAEYGGC